MAKKTSEFIEMQIIQNLQNGKTVSDVCKLFKVSKELIGRLTLKHGLRRKGEYLHSVSKEEMDKMVEMHLSGKTYRFIEKELGRSYDAVNSALNSRGYFNSGREGANRIHNVDIHSFDVIDGNEKAYWLGVLMADGSNDQKKYKISFTQAENNKELAYKFKDFLKSDHPVIITKRSLKNSNWQDVYGLHITSKTLSQSLAKHGVVQNKTNICKFPEINPEYYSHFIRGYFDGDGYINGTSKPILVSLIGTYSFLEAIHNILNIPTHSIKHRNSKHSELVFTNNLCGETARNFCNYIYNNATIFLERKYNRFIEHVEKYNKRKDLHNVVIFDIINNKIYNFNNYKSACIYINCTFSTLKRCYEHDTLIKKQYKVLKYGEHKRKTTERTCTVMD